MAFLHDSNLIPDIVAVVGMLVFCAGLHLLWLSRGDALAWLLEFVRLFRMRVRQIADPAHATLEMVSHPPQRKHAARIALGVLLAFLVAPALITLGLAF